MTATTSVLSATSAPLRIAINGYGRIGRCVLRAIHESSLQNHIQVGAINGPSDLGCLFYLTQFDSTYGVFPGKVDLGNEALRINGRDVQVCHVRESEAINWAEFGIDMLLECSGRYG